MKYITRWGLMNNTKSENISEHSLQVAMFAHLLVLLHNKETGENLNAERAAMLGLYHDTTEIITGDMPTPVKYYNPDIIASYKKVEKIAGEKLVSMLPEDLRGDYRDLSALVKCIEEIRMGNDEFRQAKESTEKSIHKMNVPEAERFMTEFLPSFSLTLDEQNT